MGKTKKFRFFCFGNPLVKQDSMPLFLMDDLRKEFPGTEFLEAGGPEDIEGQAEVNIIDTVEGISKVSDIGIDDIEEHKCCSLHDFDLAMSLKLLRKMGKLKGVKIIGIPKGYSKKKALGELKAHIKGIISSSP